MPLLARRHIMALLLALNGCAAAGLQRHCPNCDVAHIAVSSKLSPLLALSAIKVPDETHLHVYIEGDGQAWDRWRNLPSHDPTSRRLTALELMQLDQANALYLGRPCYAVRPLPATCTPEAWTDGRYSEPVIAAMNEALSLIASEHSATELVLIGHSGGGTIAMLLAQRRRDVAAVVTLAANLDHQAWTDWHGYFRLNSSLNAVDVDLPAGTVRWHFAGGKDLVVPADLVAAAVRPDRHARMEVFERFDHTCCWSHVWPDILRDLGRELAQRSL